MDSDYLRKRKKYSYKNTARDGLGQAPGRSQDFHHEGPEGHEEDSFLTLLYPRVRRESKNARRLASVIARPFRAAAIYPRSFSTNSIALIISG